MLGSYVDKEMRNSDSIKKIALSYEPHSWVDPNSSSTHPLYSLLEILRTFTSYLSVQNSQGHFLG